ncbi:MAG: hypothetical protein M1823_001135 [Watsoniomyces obsoletus]|nr:MAG: hypothetical protein M1823_001135 [Watsoniomyces obsoletus]
MRWLFALLLAWRVSCVAQMPAGPTSEYPPGPTSPPIILREEEPPMTLEDRIDQLAAFLTSPPWIALTAFVVGGYVTAFVYDVLKGEQRIPGERKVDWIRTHWVPDECRSLKDPKIDAPDFQAAAGGKYPVEVEDRPTIDAQISNRQRDEHAGFEEGVYRGRYVHNARHRKLYLEGVKAGMEAHQGILPGILDRSGTFRTRRDGEFTARDEARAYSLGVEDARRTLRPWTDQQIVLRGREGGLTALDKINRLEKQRAPDQDRRPVPISILRGYSRGLCVARCIQEEQRVYEKTDKATWDKMEHFNRRQKRDVWLVRCMEREKRRMMARRAKGIPEPYPDLSGVEQTQSQSQMEMSVQHPPVANARRVKLETNKRGWTPRWRADPNQALQDAKVAGRQMENELGKAVKGWKPPFPANIPPLRKGPKGVGALGGMKAALPVP